MNAIAMRAQLATLLVLFISACGPAPQPVEEQRASVYNDPHAGLSMEGPHPSTGGAEGGEVSDPHAGLNLASVHPGLGSHADTGAKYSGVIRLRGELADSEAFLFINVRTKGERRVAFSHKLLLEDPALGHMEDGDRVVPFTITDRNRMGGPIGEELELEAWHDMDGFVETKEEDGVIRAFPIEENDTEIDVVLAVE